MAFEVKSIDFQTKKVVGTSEFATTGLISFPQDKPLKKVLNISAYVSSVSGEVIDTDYNFQGKANLSVLYLSEDNKTERLLTEIQFQHGVHAVAEEEFVQVNVVECHIEESDAVYAKVSVLMLAEVVGKVNGSLSVLSGEEENYVTDKANTTHTAYVSGSKTNFELSGTVETDKASTVLFADTVVDIKNVVAGLDQVTVSGEARTKIGYLLEGELTEETKVIEFSRELSVDGVNPESLVSVVVTAEETTFASETDEKTKANYSVAIGALVSAYANKTESIMRDIFSTNREVEVTYGCSNYLKYQGSDSFKENITENAEIDAQDGVVLTSCYAKIAKFEILNKKVCAEGVIFATAIYKNQEELCSKQISVPFLINHLTTLQGNANLNSVQVEGLNVTKGTTENAQVSFNLIFNFSTETEQYVEYVEAIKDLGESRQVPSAITIYVAKPNDTLFSVARSLRVLPEQILSQNQVVDGKFEAGQRIFVYSPLVAEF
ncbi:MAG: LysM peptidoglycan-binding domain-containing protein [Clostridia bacterium]|nr:LysM peptidoglycan-binding domain-containing protein [Clostridia bacterium]